MNQDNNISTKEKILRKAADLFSERGYYGVSMDEIASELGISKANLYYHYESKEAILRILINDSCRELKLKLKEAVNKSVLPSDYIFNIVLTILNFRLKHPEITLLNTFGISTDNKVPALQFVTDASRELMQFIRDILSGANFFRVITYKVLQVIVINILSFTLNPFIEVKKDNNSTAKSFSKLVNLE